MVDVQKSLSIFPLWLLQGRLDIIAYVSVFTLVELELSVHLPIIDMLPEPRLAGGSDRANHVTAAQSHFEIKLAHLSG